MCLKFCLENHTEGHLCETRNGPEGGIQGASQENDRWRNNFTGLRITKLR